MTDYYTPTVITPPLPLQDISEFELFILKQFFDYETSTDNSIYFFSNVGPYLEKDVSTDVLKNLVGVPDKNDNRLVKDYWEGLEDWTDPRFTIAFDEEMLVEILENIIERSSFIKRIDVVSSYTASRMVQDGYGGRRVSVTAKYIDTIDTSDLDDEIVEETLDSSLADSIKQLVSLALDTQKCLNEVYAAMGGDRYSSKRWNKIKAINDRFEKAGLSKILDDKNNRVSESSDVENVTLWDGSTVTLSKVQLYNK